MIPGSPAHLLYDLLQIDPDESVLIIYDSTTEAICKVLANLSGGILYNLDKQERPLTELPSELEIFCKASDLVFYAISKKGSGTVTELQFRKSLHEAVEDSGGRVGNLLGVSSELAYQVLVGDPFQIKKYTYEVLELARTLASVHVTNDLGTDIVVSFDPKYKWLASTGFIERGLTRNALPAEVYTFPNSVTGKVVSDGTYGLLGYLPGFQDLEGTMQRLANNPITWLVDDSHIVDVICDDDEILECSKKAIFKDSCCSRIGEFGLGTNPFVDECTGVMFVDEKMQGVHIAHGHGYPKATGAPYECDTHYDLVITNPKIEDLSGGSIIFDYGSFNLEKE